MKRLIVLATIGLLQSHSALAHAFLDNATPLVGEIVSVAPKQIRIQFTQGVEPVFSHIALFTKDGQAVPTGTAAGDPADRTELTVPIAGTLAPGEYEVRWDVVSVDTHKTNGHFPFTYQP